MKTAAIYCRVSSEGQEIDGTSLDTQLEANLAKAVELSFTVPDDRVVREAYSGLVLERPKLSEVREWVRTREVDALIVYSTDRLSRDPVHLLFLAEECEKAQVVLCFVTEPLDNTMEGQLLGFMRGWASKLETLRLVDRTTRGRKARRTSGRLANGRANHMFGYDYIPGRGEGEGIRQVNEEQAEVVRDIFDWLVAERLPLNQIVYRLRALDIISPSGKSMWPRSTVYSILTNSAYCGSQSETTPTIVDRETFQMASQVLKRNRELAARNTKRAYLLRKYVFCEYCGYPYEGATKIDHIKSGIKEYRYYRCSSGSRAIAHDCLAHSWRAGQLEQLVWGEIEKALSEPEVLMAGLLSVVQEKDQVDSQQSELNYIETRLSEISRQQQELLRWALKGFPEETIERENELLGQDRRALEKRRAQIQDRIRVAEQATLDAGRIRQSIESIRNNLGKLSFETKRLALETLSIRVILGESSVRIEGNIPLAYGSVVSTLTNRNGERMPSISACQFTQLGHSIPLD
jgi:site-specific DNA recombinase